MEIDFQHHTILNQIHGTIRCKAAQCDEQAKFIFQRCSHAVCACCTHNSKGFVVDSKGSKVDVFFCPLCMFLFKKLSSSWITPECFFRALFEMLCCMRCCKEDALYRGNCGHLLCLSCLRRIDMGIAQSVCNVLGCTAVIRKEDLKHSYQQATVIKMWSVLKIPRYQVCNIYCRKKAVLVLKSCGHGCCYSCIQTKLMKQIEPVLSRPGEKVFRCPEILCTTRIREADLNQYLSALSTTALTAAFLLEISTEECLKCRNKSDTLLRVRNKACGKHHAFCLECLTANKSNTAVKPYLHRNESGLQMFCLVSECDSTTPVLALTAFLETLKGKSFMVEIFLRGALIFEMCTDCKKQYANVTRVACSHGVCLDCVKEIFKNRMHIYNTCRGDFGACKNIVPISIFETFFHNEIQMDLMNDESTSKKRLPKVELEISVSESSGSLTLSANVISSSAITSVTWIHNNQQIRISKSQNKFFEDASQLHPILVIENLQREDAGSYCLQVENKDGVGISNEVLFSLPSEKTRIIIEKTPNKENKSVILHAKILTKWPVKKLRWQKNKTNLFISNIIMKYVENISDEHTPVLTIQDFGILDEGKYRLLAESIDGSITSEEIEIKCLEVEKPEISVEFSIKKKERSLKFTAVIPSSVRRSKIRWTKDNQEIDFKKYRKYYSGGTTGNPTLVVYNINKDDQGEYRVAVESELTTFWSKPAVFEIPTDALGVFLRWKWEEKNVLLYADIATEEWPIISYIWQKDGQDCHPGGRCNADYSVFYHPKLRIPNFLEADNGQYTLTVETLGEVRSSSSVQVFLHAESVKPKLPKNEYNPIIYTDPQSNKNNILEDNYGNPESKIGMVKHPYTQNKACRVCQELAVAEIENCLHRFCLSCIAVLTIKSPSEYKYLACTRGCTSWISRNALDVFLKRPCAIQLEAPMYFQIKPDLCGSCQGDGLMKASYCNHSLCLDCLKKCTPDKQCEISSCQNLKLPPKHYYEYIISTLCSKKIDKDLPFIMFLEKCEGLFSNESLKCSVLSCTDKAICKVIRCGHKICAKCIKNAEKKQIKEYRLSISRCPGPYCCDEFFLLPLCRPPEKKSGLSEITQMDNESVDLATMSEKVMDAEHNEAIENKPLPRREETVSEEIKGKRKLEIDLKEQDKRQSVEKITKKLGSRGLRNIGFSCYRNSILQILAETPYFLERVSQCLLEKKKEWISSLCLILEGIRTNTTEENIDILYQFHHEFNQSNPEYREYEQEDCLSFLTTLLNGIQDACTENHVKTGDPVDLFRGKWRDKYVCKKCLSKEYYNDSEFFHLPLPYTEKKKKEATIGSCFLGLLADEEIDMFSCSTCGCNKMTKQLDIVHFPLILVLQFSKIHEVDSRNQECNFEKRSNFVKFWDTFEGLKNIELKQKIGDDTLRPYRLFGVVVHWGSEKSGHYISYVKIKEFKWKRCDDSYVDDVSLKSVLRNNAYLLFYEKCETSV